MIGHNDAIIMSHVLDEAFGLLSGRLPVDPSTFYNMCHFVEAAVLHDRLLLAGFLSEDQYLKFFEQKGLIAHFGAFGQTPDAEVNQKLEVYALFNKAQILYHAHGGPGTFLDLNSYGTRLSGYEDYYAFISSCLREGAQWWIGEGKMPAGKEDDIASFTKALREIVNVATFLRIPVYDDAMVMPLELAYYVRLLPVLNLYAKLSDYFGVTVQRIFDSEGVKVMRIPPLVSILLSRCRRRDDIPAKILELRDEFASLRELTKRYDRELSLADSLGEKLAVLADFESAWDALLRKLQARETRLLYRVWDVVKKGSPLGMLAEAIDKLKDREEELRVVPRVNAFLDVWNAAKNISSYEHLVQQVFGGVIDTSLFDQYLDLAAKVTERFRLGPRWSAA